MSTRCNFIAVGPRLRRCTVCHDELRTSFAPERIFRTCSGPRVSLAAVPTGANPSRRKLPQGQLEWVSTAQLAKDATILAGKLPLNISGVAGIVRSGMIPAAVIATQLQLPLYELNETGGLRRLGHGSRGRSLGFAKTDGPLAVIDDTTYSGSAMRKARRLMARLGKKAVFAAIYHRPEAGKVVDHYARVLASPHLLEWNFANNGPVVGLAQNHAAYKRGVAFDIDGIIVHDTDSGGVPGSPYLPPRTHAVNLLVTGRHERTRQATENMLRSRGVKWKKLVMLPDATPPTSINIATFKAKHYASSGCGFFIESDPLQAEVIHQLTKLPVICPRDNRVWSRGPATSQPLPPLVSPLMFSPVFAPLVGKRVGLIHSRHTGNAGDRLIEETTEQLLHFFQIDYQVQEPDANSTAEVLLLFGGGNFGHENCPIEASRRAKALATGKPCVLLPQTAYGPEPGEYAMACVRETTSLQYLPQALVLPDIAMAYSPQKSLAAPTRDRGEFFTSLKEGNHAGRGTDPRHQFSNGSAYFEFVASHRELVTDCLHVAICGLIARRNVTLVATKLHKQESMWHTWLRHYGCQFSASTTTAIVSQPNIWQNTDSLPCRHRGNVLREARCDLCGSRGQTVSIYECGKHGVCSLRRYRNTSQPEQVCLLCPDRQSES